MASEAAYVGLVRSRTEDGIAILTIENPPVNALAQPVRQSLLLAVLAAEAAPTVHALLIIGAGKQFVAGADIREFEAPPRQPLLNDVLLRLEACAKPVIVALNGAALGGGLELALASHYRCAIGAARVGLPEVKLGLLPGSGGTQRLPRLVGVEVSLRLMLDGAPIPAARARDLGIIDKLLEGTDALAGGIAFAHELLARAAAPRRLCELAVSGEGIDPDFFGARGHRARRAR